MSKKKAGRPTLGDCATERFHMAITRDEIEAIDNWRYANRVPTRSETVRRLTRIGIAADGLIEALRECEEFFDDRADAEYFTDSATPHHNKEMTLLTLVRDAIKKAGA